MTMGMLIVGERINTSRAPIRKALADRNARFIQEEARAQLKAGANFIDVNAGTSVRTEPEDLAWLVQVVQEAVDAPLAIDTANPAAAERALAVHRGRPIINSISAEKARLKMFLPLVKAYDTLVVALVMDDCGMPQDLEGRLRIARMISQEVEAAGVSRESLYFDMLVRPISTDQLQVKAVLEAVRGVRLELPNTHTICGLSNISFGLPARNQINRAFLVLALEAGLDAVILDPTEPGVMAAVYATNAILGRDDYCLQYIAAEREGKLI